MSPPIPYLFFLSAATLTAVSAQTTWGDAPGLGLLAVAAIATILLTIYAANFATNFATVAVFIAARQLHHTGIDLFSYSSPGLAHVATSHKLPQAEP